MGGTYEAEAMGAPLTMPPDHDPAPRLQPVELPNGEGLAALVKVDEHEWRVERFEGPKEGTARHAFRELGSFIRWLERSTPAPRRAQVFVEILSPTKVPQVQARLDPGDPTGDRVTCDVPHSPAFRAWVLSTAGKRLSQKGLFALVRGYGWAIEGENQADSLLMTLAALRVIANQSLEVEIAPNGRTKVAGKRGEVTIDRELPGELSIRVPIFEGVTDAVAKVRTYGLRAILDVEAHPDEGLSVGITFPDLEDVLSSAAIDLVEHVETSLGEGWVVCIGTEKTEPQPKRSDVARIGNTASAGIAHP